MADTEAGPPRAALIAALVLAIGALGVVLVIAARPHPTNPVVIAPVPAPHARDAACAKLIDALPPRLGDFTRAPLIAPVPQGAAAWQTNGGGDVVVLQCGLQRPADFVVGSPIQMVDTVQWFQVSPDRGSIWYTVDRPVYIALTLPPRSGPTPIQQLSEIIDQTVPAQPPDPLRR